MSAEAKARVPRAKTKASLSRRLVPWLAFMIVLTVVLGLIYGFHIYGDETLCPDRESLIRRVTALQQEVDVLHSRHSDEKQGWIAKGGSVTGGGVAAAAASNVVADTGKQLVTTASGTDVTMGSPALRELIFRQNTRYWYETQPYWPIQAIPPTEKYVTFEPWHGGFNNIRMSLEIAFGAAFAFGRTLVMPPTFRMYLRGKSSLADYFDLEHMKKGIPVITYEEFAKRTGLNKYQGGAKHSDDGGSTTKAYANIEKMPGVILHDEAYMGGKIASQVVYCFPECPKAGMRGAKDNFFSKVSHKLSPINGNDPKTVASSVIHFRGNMLGHFYTMFWFKDPQKGKQLKRLIRDHVHFKEEIFALAERIITKLGDFEFSCLHVRRNDFQFEDAWTPAKDIVTNTKRLFKPNEKIYIATDELSVKGKKKDSSKWGNPDAMAKVQTHAWFEPMMEEWGVNNVHFLSEFYPDLEAAGLKKIHIGCIETIVCSRARVFAGTRKSTFTGYINRLRGYMHDVGQKYILENQSKYPEDYLTPLQGPSWGLFPSGSFGGGHPFWGREYKEVWEGVYDPFY